MIISASAALPRSMRSSSNYLQSLMVSVALMPSRLFSQLKTGMILLITVDRRVMAIKDTIDFMRQSMVQFLTRWAQPLSGGNK